MAANAASGALDGAQHSDDDWDIATPGTRGAEQAAAAEALRLAQEAVQQKALEAAGPNDLRPSYVDPMQSDDPWLN